MEVADHVATGITTEFEPIRHVLPAAKLKLAVVLVLALVADASSRLPVTVVVLFVKFNVPVPAVDVRKVPAIFAT